MRILIAEDDEILGDALATSLTLEGFAVDWLTNGADVTHALSVETFDLLILDLGLPGQDGLSVLRTIRSRENGISVLILTARDTVQDRILGLDSGADDYLLKPFDIDELHARIRSLIRRSSGRATTNIIYKDLTISPEAHTVHKNGTPVSLTHIQFQLLIYLMENQGRVLTRQRLKETLYGWNCDQVDSNTIEVHISHIRKKIDNALIRTIRGVGYTIEKSE